MRTKPRTSSDSVRRKRPGPGRPPLFRSGAMVRVTWRLPVELVSLLARMAKKRRRGIADEARARLSQPAP